MTFTDGAKITKRYNSAEDANVEYIEKFLSTIITVTDDSGADVIDGHFKRLNAMLSLSRFSHKRLHVCATISNHMETDTETLTQKCQNDG